MKIKIMALWRKPKEKFMEMVLPGIVEELLGADLMEHNILHKVLTFWTQIRIFFIISQHLAHAQGIDFLNPNKYI